MGVVTKVGPGVSGFQEGQRVTALGWMGHEGNGSWQQYINVPAERVVALPDGISDEAGAQFYVSVCRGAECAVLAWLGGLACTRMNQLQHTSVLQASAHCRGLYCGGWCVSGSWGPSPVVSAVQSTDCTDGPIKWYRAHA